MSYLGIENELRTINRILSVGSVTIGSGTVNIGGGTVNITGALTGANPSDGTLTQLGTMYYVAGLGMGTVVIASGTLTGSNPSAGTLDILTQIGTLPTLGTMGTLYYAANLGTCFFVNSVEQIGTLPNIIVGSGTIQTLNNGTLTTVSNCYLAGAGTVMVAAGTINVNQVAGTVDVLTQVGTLPTLGTLGTLFYTSNVGTLHYQNNLGTTYYVDSVKTLGTLDGLVNGTLGVSAGTLNSVGSVNSFAKHDLHVYDTLGTFLTDQGTLVQTASKIIKVHYYHAQADGTFAFHFADTKPNGGTLSCGWYFNQREGVVTSFVPYPACLFKTSTTGSALVLGTWPSIPCNGTLRLTMIYTDDDTT